MENLMIVLPTLVAPTQLTAICPAVAFVEVFTGGWRDAIGFRGAQDVEHPVGEWNRVEIECRGGDLAYPLNGRLVNTGTGGTYREGKILLQSEDAEIYFRRIELHPLRALTTSPP